MGSLGVWCDFADFSPCWIEGEMGVKPGNGWEMAAQLACGSRWERWERVVVLVELGMQGSSCRLILKDGYLRYRLSGGLMCKIVEIIE